MRMPLSFDEFLSRYPAYDGTRHLDDLRRADYTRLDATGQVYLDYTGAGVYAESQVRAHAGTLVSSLYGNPHSGSPTSAASTAVVERARRAVVRWFSAGDDYVAIFTANASAALKLVGESYPFSEERPLLMSADNHNSVNGIREFAAARGAACSYAPMTYPELRLDEAAVREQLAAGPPGLFAFPAQSNFTGVRHPLMLVDQAQRLGWHVLLDAAAFVPTNRLDLARVRPDFVTVSFYKMFGYPTGVGCLIARRDALATLRRPWFAGGTVDFATVHARRHLLSPGEAGFEDGTLDFLSIPAVEIGLEHLRRAGIDAIHTRVEGLTSWLLDELVAMTHSNGRAMVRIYGPVTPAMRGGTVTMNVYDPEGHLLDYRRVEELAAAKGISLRTGCFCNPGAGESAEGLTDEDIEAAMDSGIGMTLPRFLQFITHRSGKSAGAIRVSLGIVSSYDDVRAFLEFVASLRDQTRLTLGDVTFDIARCRIIRDGS